MRLLVLATILFAAIGCDKTIHEVRTAPPQQDTPSPILATDLAGGPQ